MNQPVTNSNNSQAAPPGPGKRKVNPKTILIIVGVVVVLGIIGMVVNMVEGNGDKQPSNSIAQSLSSSSQHQPASVPVAAASDATSPEITSSETAFNVDWDVCINEFVEDMLNTQDFLTDISVTVKDKQINFMAVVQDATAPEVALEFADTMLRRFNLSATAQDSSIASGTKDSYGGLYDVYGVLIGIAPQSQTGDTDKWFVYDAVAKGVQTKQEIKLQKAYRK